MHLLIAIVTGTVDDNWGERYLEGGIDEATAWFFDSFDKWIVHFFLLMIYSYFASVLFRYFSSAIIAQLSEADKGDKKS